MNKYILIFTLITFGIFYITSPALVNGDVQNIPAKSIYSKKIHTVTTSSTLVSSNPIESKDRIWLEIKNETGFVIYVTSISDSTDIELANSLNDHQLFIDISTKSWYTFRITGQNSQLIVTEGRK